MKSLLALALFVNLPLLGCATVFGERYADIQITSNPDGATVHVEGRRIAEGCETPCRLRVNKPNALDDLVLSVEKEGYKPEYIRLEPEVTSIAYANCCWLGSDCLIGWGVDAITGDLHDYDESLHIPLSKHREAAPAAAP